MTIRALFLAVFMLFATPALAVDFPPLTGRVVDQANLLSPEQEAQLTQRLEALEQATSRQLVVATVPSLQDLPIEDYGYQLGRAWHLGQADSNNGAILLVAPNERKVRIEVGYGLEGIMTDALSSQIIRDTILPRFRDNDYPGGIIAGADAIIAQFQAPPEAAEQRAVQAAQAQQQQQGQRHGGSPFPFIIWMVVIFFIFMSMIGAGRRGRRYRRGVSVWGPGAGGGGSGVPWFLAGMALDNLSQRRRRGPWGDSGGSSWGDGGGSSWGGGGGSDWGGGGGGGFSGGGGSFGGGGASGGW